MEKITYPGFGGESNEEELFARPKPELSDKEVIFPPVPYETMMEGVTGFGGETEEEASMMAARQSAQQNSREENK